MTPMSRRARRREMRRLRGIERKLQREVRSAIASRELYYREWRRAEEDRKAVFAKLQEYVRRELERRVSTVTVPVQPTGLIVPVHLVRVG